MTHTGPAGPALGGVVVDNSRTVRSSSVVLPDPGELIRLTATAPRAANQAWFPSAKRSFLASRFSSMSTVRVWAGALLFWS